MNRLPNLILKNYQIIGHLLLIGIISSCKEDTPQVIELTGESKIYNLDSKSDPGISGTVEFAQKSDNSTRVTIKLTGTNSGSDHPAHMHANNAVDGGSIMLDLNSVKGDSGLGETDVTSLNDGTSITYSELINYDGYINVHLSESDLSTLIAQGDIGQNEMTGNSINYELFSVTDPYINGEALFEERLNGETRVTIQMEGTIAGNSHPAHIHGNTAAKGGGILIDLAFVDGETGLSISNLSEMNNGTPISYDELLDFNGFINVHLSEVHLETLIAQGDIGKNTFTGKSTVYDLHSKSDPAIIGTATFQERKSGFTLATLQLTGTSSGGDHPSHIHNNNAASGGPVAINLVNVNGASGLSKTEITQKNDGTSITYNELINYNGYINVHFSASDLATLIAQGDIGSNAN